MIEVTRTSKLLYWEIDISHPDILSAAREIINGEDGYAPIDLMREENIIVGLQSTGSTRMYHVIEKALGEYIEIIKHHIKETHGAVTIHVWGTPRELPDV